MSAGLKKCTQGQATEIAKDMRQIAFSVTKVTKLIVIDIVKKADRSDKIDNKDNAVTLIEVQLIEVIDLMVIFLCHCTSFVMLNNQFHILAK